MLYSMNQVGVPCVDACEQKKWMTRTPAMLTEPLLSAKRAATGAPSGPPASKKPHRTMLQVFASLNGDNRYRHRPILAPIEDSDGE